VYVILFGEGLYVQKIEFPQVHEVRQSIGIAQEQLPDMPMLSVSFLLFQPGSDNRFLFPW